MAKFCPEWVFSSSVAAVAGGFLYGNAPITVFANQFSNELLNIFISSRIIVRKKINNIIFTSNITQIFFILLILVISYFFEYRNILIIISIFVLSNLISSLINYNFLSGEKKLFNELFKIFILVNFLFLLTLIFEPLLNLNFKSKIIIILSIFTLLFFYYYSIRKEVFKILNEASN